MDTNSNTNSNKQNGSAKDLARNSHIILTSLPFTTYVSETLHEIDPNITISQDTQSYLQGVIHAALAEATWQAKRRKGTCIERDHLELALERVIDNKLSQSGGIQQDSAEDGTSSTSSLQNITSPSPFEYYRVVDAAIKAFDDLYAIDKIDNTFWSFIGEKNHVQMFEKQENEFTYLKAVCEIEKSPKELLDILRDLPSLTSWSALVKEARVVEQLDSHTDIIYLLYSTSACLFTMRRDFCLAVHWYQRPDGACLYVANSAEHPHCPAKPGITRGIAYGSGYIILPKEEFPFCGRVSIATFITKLDLRGLPFVATGYAKQKQLQALYYMKKYATGVP